VFRPANRPRRPRAVFARLGLEALEDRRVPAAVTYGPAFDVATGLPPQSEVGRTVARADNGNFAETWKGNDGIYVRLYNASGTPLTAAQKVAGTTGPDDSSPTIAMSANGAFVVAWVHLDSANDKDVRGVINEDRVQPGRGFGTHPHRDMEIVSYVLEGALEHKDSMGTGSVIRPGDVQRMSAGTGVTHSEYNGSKTEKVHFLQIWILPERAGVKPGYEQRTFSREEKDGRLRLVASRDGRDGSVTINADAAIYAGNFVADQRAELPLAAGRHAYVHVARGEVHVNGITMRAGDGAALSDEPAVIIDGAAGGEVLVFDLA
jgi:hypothetical protein